MPNANLQEHSKGTRQVRLPFAATVLAHNTALQQQPGDLLHPDEVRLPGARVHCGAGMHTPMTPQLPHLWWCDVAYHVGMVLSAGLQ